MGLREYNISMLCSNKIAIQRSSRKCSSVQIASYRNAIMVLRATPLPKKAVWKLPICSKFCLFWEYFKKSGREIFERQQKTNYIQTSFLFLPQNTEGSSGLSFPRHRKAFHNSLPLEKSFTDTFTKSEAGENENTVINQRKMGLPPKPSTPFLQHGVSASWSKHTI